MAITIRRPSPLKGAPTSSFKVTPFSPFFKDSDRLSDVPPEDFDLPSPIIEPQHLSDRNRLWLEEIWQAMDAVVRMFEWRDVSTKPIHISRCLCRFATTQIDCLEEVRNMLIAGRATDVASRGELERKADRYLNDKDEYINDDEWYRDINVAITTLLKLLHQKGIPFNVLALLELLALYNKHKPSESQRKQYLDVVEFELWSNIPLEALHGQDLW